MQKKKMFARAEKRNLTYPMSLPGSQGMSMPNFMSIGSKLWALEGYRQTDCPVSNIWIREEGKFRGKFFSIFSAPYAVPVFRIRHKIHTNGLILKTEIANRPKTMKSVQYGTTYSNLPFTSQVRYRLSYWYICLYDC